MLLHTKPQAVSARKEALFVAVGATVEPKSPEPDCLFVEQVKPGYAKWFTFLHAETPQTKLDLKTGSGKRVLEKFHKDNLMTKCGYYLKLDNMEHVEKAKKIIQAEKEQKVELLKKIVKHTGREMKEDYTFVQKGTDLYKFLSEEGGCEHFLKGVKSCDSELGYKGSYVKNKTAKKVIKAGQTGIDVISWISAIMGTVLLIAALPLFGLPGLIAGLLGWFAALLPKILKEYAKGNKSSIGYILIPLIVILGFMSSLSGIGKNTAKLSGDAEYDDDKKTVSVPGLWSKTSAVTSIVSTFTAVIMFVIYLFVHVDSKVGQYQVKDVRVMVNPEHTKTFSDKQKEALGIDSKKEEGQSCDLLDLQKVLKEDIDELDKMEDGIDKFAVTHNVKDAFSN